jgi:hypothetical protein
MVHDVPDRARADAVDTRKVRLARAVRDQTADPSNLTDVQLGLETGHGAQSAVSRFRLLEPALVRRGRVAVRVTRRDLDKVAFAKALRDGEARRLVARETDRALDELRRVQEIDGGLVHHAVLNHALEG